jgi:hypothetical protein
VATPPLRRAAPPRLRNRDPAHVFTDEDRRKAAAVTNQIRRKKREILELELLAGELERRKLPGSLASPASASTARRRRSAIRKPRRSRSGSTAGYRARLERGMDGRINDSSLRRAALSRPARHIVSAVCGDESRPSMHPRHALVLVPLELIPSSGARLPSAANLRNGPVDYRSQ